MSDPFIRPVRADEYPAFITAIREGFAADAPPADEMENACGRLMDLLPPSRTLAAFDGGSIVGTFGGFDLELTVPGGTTIPMEGTTIVTVFPTHRRMGLLSRMMTEHLDNAVAAGYPVAGLWSSDADIYARFGYGIATNYRSVEMRSAQIEFRDEIAIDRVRRIDPVGISELVGPVFDRVRTSRAGMFARTTEWWSHRQIVDEPWMRDGKSTRRWVVHDGPDGVDGFASYRQKQGFAEGYSNGSVAVTEVESETPEAHASLWSYLTTIDGCPDIEYWNMALDDPLPRMVKEPRRVRATETRDALWLRVLDVKRALESRTYEADGSLVLGIEDRFRPAASGTFRLDVSASIGAVTEVDTAPDVQMADDVLGALYLGGQSAGSYAMARRIVGSSESISLLDRLFRTMQSPWVQEIF
jgi:predicted acetyltransferase